MDRNHIFDGFRALWSPQFGFWMLIWVPFTVGVIYTLIRIDLAVQWVFFIGIFHSQVSDRAVNWFTEWYVLDKKVSQWSE